ncbi:MAG: heavy-metal-associated domain-containing protein [Bauldia sp.]
MYRLQVPKLHCDNCAGRVSRAVTGVDPGASVKADLINREISVESTADLSEIRAALERIGYPAMG